MIVHDRALEDGFYYVADCDDQGEGMAKTRTVQIIAISIEGEDGVSVAAEFQRLLKVATDAVAAGDSILETTNQGGIESVVRVRVRRR